MKIINFNSEYTEVVIHNITAKETWAKILNHGEVGVQNIANTLIFSRNNDESLNDAMWQHWRSVIDSVREFAFDKD